MAKEEQPFPIVEAYGFAAEATSASARDARNRRWCPFMDRACEKIRQYPKAAPCSITYAAAGDQGEHRTYAICDHRFDGEAIQLALQDHFQGTETVLVSEVGITDPKMSFDYVAFEKGHDENVVAIETQVVDTRGGSVVPAWRALEDGKVHMWQAYFAEEARRTNRKELPPYGVNLGNVYKRLGLQVVTKGSFLKAIGVRLYVLMQDSPFEYFRKRIRFEPVSDEWDITFMTFDYGARRPDGRYDFPRKQVVRTSLRNYVSAMSAHVVSDDARAEFLERVRRKALQR